MIVHSRLTRNKETSKDERNRKICAGREKLSSVHSTDSLWRPEKVIEKDCRNAITLRGNCFLSAYWCLG